MIKREDFLLMVKSKDGFEGLIQDMVDFPNFSYLHAKKKVQKGLYEHRVYVNFSQGNKMKLISRVFEDKIFFPNKKYFELNKMIAYN